MAHLQVVRLAVGVDDAQIEHLDVGAAHVQANGLEATFAPADADEVAILAEQRDLLAAQLLPVDAPAPGPGRPGRAGATGPGRERAGSPKTLITASPRKFGRER